MEQLISYGFFLLKTATLILGLLVLLLGIVAILSKGKKEGKGSLSVEKLNDKYQRIKDHTLQVILSKKDYKKYCKQQKTGTKKQQQSDRKRVFLIEFNGDLRANAVSSLREEISAILGVAKNSDEVVVLLESPGGVVNTYGLGASQLSRIREEGIPLTVIIDKVAASGGYLMASVANKIIAAPFAFVGSIGVVGQLPNFHRYLKKHAIDYELHTAGEYKRTLTMLGENDNKGRDKFQEEIQAIHDYFKEFIQHYRPQLDITKVATGEHWLATDGYHLKLVDQLLTSDDYLSRASKECDIFKVSYRHKKHLSEKVAANFRALQQSIFDGFRQSKEFL